MQENRHEPPVKEFRLEGAGLFIVGGLFLAALAGSFYLGRWVERSAAIPGSSDVLENATFKTDSEPPVDVGKETTYFDTVSGGEKEPEPAREAARREPPAAAPDTPQLAMPAVSAQPPGSEPGQEDAGPFYVQLFAGRDQASAENLVRNLGAAGYRVRLDTERSADGALYKVRVGGYAAKADAQVLADRLKGDGYSGAWVTRVD